MPRKLGTKKESKPSASAKKRSKPSKKTSLAERPQCAALECKELVTGSPQKGFRDFCRDHLRTLSKSKAMKAAWEEGSTRSEILDFLKFRDAQLLQWYTYEIRPTPDQVRFFRMQCKQHRVVYNWAYDKLDTWWQTNRTPNCPGDMHCSWTCSEGDGETLQDSPSCRPIEDQPTCIMDWSTEDETGDGDQHGTMRLCTDTSIRRNWDKSPMPDISYTRFTAEMVNDREGFAWLEQCIANARNYALRDAKRAFDNFCSQWMRRKANPRLRQVGYPKRKKVRDSNSWAYQPASADAKKKVCPTVTWMHDRVRDRAIEISTPRARPDKVGWVKTKESTRKLRGRVQQIQIEYHAKRWYMKVLVEREPKGGELGAGPFERELPGSVIGLDLGVNNIITLSRPYMGANPPAFLGEDRQTVVPPRPLGTLLKRKQRMNRKWSRQGSAGYRRRLWRLLDGPITLSAWRGPTHKGYFEAIVRLALRLRHIEVHNRADELQEKVHEIGAALQDADAARQLMVQLSSEGRRAVDEIQPVYYEHDDVEYVRINPSKKWEAQKLALQVLDKHIADVRADHLNKVSTWLVRTYETIVCEGFDVVGLVEKHGGNGAVRSTDRRREISDLGWGGLRERLNYKTDPHWYGGTFIALDKLEATDCSCSNCGHINKKLSPFTNQFACVICGFKETRQRNTAMYCESFGREPESTGGQPGTDGPGEQGPDHGFRSMDQAHSLKGQLHHGEAPRAP